MLETLKLNKKTTFNVEKIRKDFPILSRKINGRPLVYLDNAATTQKPQSVVDALEHYYTYYNANIHRGVYQLSEDSTLAYEEARENVRKFINAADSREIIFTRGATEAINLVAQSYGRYNIKEDDEIIISNMEHHANIVPWQVICTEKKAKLRIIPITDSGELMMDEFMKLLNDRTRFISVNQISNTLGTINPVKQIIETAHRRNIPVLIDGAQAVPHMKVDVKELDCDFYAFSGHKLFGPTGIGVLYGKADLLETMPPYQTGGDMIKSVTFEKTVYNDLPFKFEAGTPNIAGGIGLSASIDYLNKLDFDAISTHEAELLVYAAEKLNEIQGLKLIGTAAHKAAVVSFIMDNIHPHDIGTVLDSEGIAIRTGHHCTQPLMQRYGIPATARASFSIYNTKEEVDKLISGIHKVIKVFR
ncbi:MAG: SufS family cysteine desulfurase [Ignavibacteria bacterium]